MRRMRLISFLLLASLLLVALAFCDDHTHTWSEWKVSTPATSDTAGEQYRECPCGEKETDTIPPTGETGGNDDNTPPANTFTNYSITLQTIDGSPLSGVSLTIYTDEALTIPMGSGTTNSKGVAKMELPSGGNYWCVIGSGLPAGFQPNASYPLTTNTKITLASSVILDQDITGVNYVLGDIIHDFVVTDCDGNTFQLSEVLKTKKMVLINFWYIDCYWCVKEFPYMQTVYEEYKNDVAIIALNPYSSDTEAKIRAFRDQHGLTFQVAQDTIGLVDAFSTYAWGFPTSIVVDRYGMICLAECSGIVDYTPFRAMFSFFTSDGYQSTIIDNIDELVAAYTPTADVTVPVTQRKKESD